MNENTVEKEKNLISNTDDRDKSKNALSTTDDQIIKCNTFNKYFVNHKNKINKSFIEYVP